MSPETLSVRGLSEKYAKTLKRVNVVALVSSEDLCGVLGRESPWWDPESPLNPALICVGSWGVTYAGLLKLGNVHFLNLQPV